MEGFEWVMEIKDGMSRPAAEMKSALATLDRSLRSTEAEMRSLQRLQNTYRSAGFKQGAAEVGKDLSKLRLGAAETRAQLKALTEATAESGPSMMGSMAGAIGLTFGLAQVVSWAKEAYAWMGRVALAGLEMSVKASEAREHLTRMFSGLGGGQAAGEAMYATVQKMRKIVPESEEEISRWAATLAAAGM